MVASSYLGMPCGNVSLGSAKLSLTLTVCNEVSGELRDLSVRDTCSLPTETEIIPSTYTIGTLEPNSGC